MKYCKLFFLALLTIFTACKEVEKPITKEEATKFAGFIKKSIAIKDASFLNDAIDMDLLIERVKVIMPYKPSSYWRELKIGKDNLRFGDKIVSEMDKTSTYKLIKQYEKDGRQHLLFRLYTSSGINYHDLELAKKQDKVKISDIYIYMTGEYFSTTLKDLYTSMDDLGDNVAQQKAKDMTRINSLMQRGDYQAAKDMIDDLPFDLKKVKAVQLYNVQVCSQLSDSLHQKAIEQLQRDFPNDPSLDLVLIDGYFLRKKYDEALACVERLDKRINTDPMLDYFRGLIYNLQDKKAEAEQTFERLYKNMPEFSAGAIELSTYYMDKSEYEKAAALLQKIKKNDDYDPSSLGNLYILYPKMQEYMTNQ